MLDKFYNLYDVLEENKNNLDKINKKIEEDLNKLEELPIVEENFARRVRIKTELLVLKSYTVTLNKNLKKIKNAFTIIREKIEDDEDIEEDIFEFKNELEKFEEKLNKLNDIYKTLEQPDKIETDEEIFDEFEVYQ